MYSNGMVGKRANGFTRTRHTKKEQLRYALENPIMAQAELCRRNLSEFIKFFWDAISSDELIWNWHIDYLSSQLTKIAQQVADGEPKENDLIINIPPGTTKSVTCSVMFPVWCWTKWPWMRFIASSYSGALALEQAELSRDLVRSDKFKALYPEINIKRDKDTKSNFKIEIRRPGRVTPHTGGNRYSTSVGGTLTGFHGHILIVDDPLDPNRSVSETELESANRWIDQTLSTRKINKAVTPTVLIMQRLHQNDPTGHILAKKKQNVFHISLPGEIRSFPEEVKPEHLIDSYVDDLLDPNRMPWEVMQELEADLGQYGYSGQVGQKPTPPGGGMFKVDHFQYVDRIPGPNQIDSVVRYWDKAGSKDAGAYTVGVKMYKLKSGKFIISDVKRGQWSSDERERIIRQTAEADGSNVTIYQEQEPGSGGKESAEGTIRNLAGFRIYSDRPTGDKIYRADPYSVQVNNGNVLLLTADWGHDFIEEHRFFPYGTYKDQVDAAAGAFNKLNAKKKARTILR